MILHGVRAGSGTPTVLLHGLFGTATNFGTVQRRLAVGRDVLALDLRNHGASPHDGEVGYEVMARDVLETMAAAGMAEAALVGHSMGGKVAMTAALLAPERVSRLLVADIAPVAYPPRNGPIAAAMLGLTLRPGLTRAAAEAALEPAVPEAAVRRFLLSNLRLGEAPRWRIGLRELADGMAAIEGWSGAGRYEGPVLALRGELSDYVRPEHRAVFRALFPHVRFASIRGAGHWLHADQPDAFVQTVAAFVPAGMPG